MPKGKILMGKKTPKPPVGRAKNPDQTPGPVQPTPKGNWILDAMLPGKPGDFKNKKMPSYLRKPKPVATRRGGY